MSALPPFSLTGPLPRGRVAIEASAGTGKTYALAGLALRYIAETDLGVGGLLVVTFTRAAAAELRERIRSRLADAAQVLRGEQSCEDELTSFLNRGDRAQYLGRIERGLSDFDTATITTIHGFAQQARSTLGAGAWSDPDAVLLEDSSELVPSVCADILTAESLANPALADELPRASELAQLVTRVLSDPALAVIPSSDPLQSTPRASRRRLLLDRALEAVAHRREIAASISFDDLLIELRDGLRRDPAAAALLRRRYTVALIDEFQDTDPVQWELFSLLFGDESEGSTLVLVGDPKQSIYAFRGANVHTYLEATTTREIARSSLTVNFRSDKALVDALGQLFRGATFGDPRITFSPVSAAPGHQISRLTTDTGRPLPALRIRAALDRALAGGAVVPAGVADNAIARDLATELQRLLERGRLPLRDDPSRSRPVRPSDIAVLIGRHSEAEGIAAALTTRSIPAIVTRADSVACSEAASQWRSLLEAIDRPSDPARARSAALTWFFGWSLSQIATATESELAAVQERLACWAEILQSRGAAELCSAVRSTSGVDARVLCSAAGDRRLSDLDHISELLAGSQLPTRRPTPASLLASLDRRSETSSDPESDPTARRIESEADAVQIMTVYAAKGLEFPVVCIPTLWRASYASARSVVFFDPKTRERTLDIANGESWPTKGDAARRRELANAEAVGENLRLAYVALTRAEHHCLVWWTRAKGSEKTGLGRLLFAREAGSIDPARFEGEKVELPDDDDVAGLLRLIFPPGGEVEISIVGGTGEAADRIAPSWTDRARPPAEPDLELAVLGRPLNHEHRRWSFTAISARARPQDLDPDDPSLSDAGASDEVGEDSPQSHARSTGNAWFRAVPGGREFGTLVHEVLERVDFHATDLDRALRDCVEDRLARNPWPVEEVALVAGLRAALETPLGPLFCGARLADFAAEDCRKELRFDLRLGTPARHATAREIGALAVSHLPPGDAMAAFAEHLAAGLFDVELTGYLTGSIDAVLRLVPPAGPSSEPRFFVVDYKTTTIPESLEDLGRSAYRPERLPAAMAEHHYPLQALLYSVALHRYLRWRLGGYEPSRHLGGVGYLFVRGMEGPHTPIVDGQPCGVFSWAIPAPLVIEASDLLAGLPVRR